ncbi:DASH complex subunit dam1 [Bachmanniomyces sp. S44760]|nr:DASH complex subunit dam1 [Bachmanniomyces sp. S44760]
MTSELEELRSDPLSTPRICIRVNSGTRDMPRYTVFRNLAIIVLENDAGLSVAIMESSSANRKRSTSRPRPSSRPTTPLRPSSRTSLREVHGLSNSRGSAEFPLDALENQFAEFSDSMADLEANFMHLQLMHESLSRFSESFASFLYGLNMNAFCVDFPEVALRAPIRDSFKRAQQIEAKYAQSAESEKYRPDFDPEMTFMTTDTSFIENPPASSKATPKFQTPAPASRTTANPERGRGGVGRGGRGRGTERGARGSGLARAKPRGVR